MQLLMETAGEGGNAGSRMMPRRLQELEQRVARRRLSQARHRATLAGLFGSLRKAVYSHSDLTASKVWGPEGREEKLPHMERLWSQGGVWPGAPSPRAAARVGQRPAEDTSQRSVCSGPYLPAADKPGLRREMTRREAG